MGEKVGFKGNHYLIDIWDGPKQAMYLYRNRNIIHMYIYTLDRNIIHLYICIWMRPDILSSHKSCYRNGRFKRYVQLDGSSCSSLVEGHMDVSKNKGKTPQNGWFVMENPIKIG